MYQHITMIATLSLVFAAIAFYFVGFIHFKMKLTERNSITTYGTLVGFRAYYPTDRHGNYAEDYLDNKKGRVPIVRFRVDEEMLDIAASRPDYSLEEEDIGKQVRVRYRRFFGITMVIDDARSLKNYNQLKTVLFWVLFSIATILLVFGILAYLCLPGIFENIAN